MSSAAARVSDACHLLPRLLLPAYGGGRDGFGAGDITSATCDAKAAAFFFDDPQRSAVEVQSLLQPSVMVAPVCASLLIHFGKGFPTTSSQRWDAKWLQFRFNKLYDRAGHPCRALTNISTNSLFVRWHTPISTDSRYVAPTNEEGSCFGCCGHTPDPAQSPPPKAISNGSKKDTVPWPKKVKGRRYGGTTASAYSSARQHK